MPTWRQEFNACRNCDRLENELAEAREEIARLESEINRQKKLNMSGECDRLRKEIARLRKALECTLSALRIASRQLTEDMKSVLNGKQWGEGDIKRAEKVLGIKS